MLLMRRRPLLRGALIGGTAYAIGRNAARRQQAEAQQDAAIRELQVEASAPVGPSTPAGSDGMAELTRLGQMRSEGLLSDAEFTAAKARLLGT